MGNCFPSERDHDRNNNENTIRVIHPPQFSESSQSNKEKKIKEYIPFIDVPIYLGLINIWPQFKNTPKDQTNEEPRECIICLEEIKLSDTGIYFLPCRYLYTVGDLDYKSDNEKIKDPIISKEENFGHFYHSDCLLRWFKTCCTTLPKTGPILEIEKFKCPLCQQMLMP